jgi:aminomethyltransferase
MKTALNENHRKNGAKFFSFAGWEMPLQFRGIFQETKAVRTSAGLFDVSHMGRIDIAGKDTLSFLDHLSSNSVLDKPFGKAFYTVLCNESGGAVDDLLIFLISETQAFTIANAINREQDLNHLKEVGKAFQVEITPRYASDGILSLQGPLSRQILERVLRNAPKLSHMEFRELPEYKIILSRTGYTGEDGYEIFAPHAEIVSLWEKLLEVGRPDKLEPCGLGARDLLRLEMGYALYGHELSPAISPIESVAQWVVKLKDHNFLGKAAIEKLAMSGKQRYPVALSALHGIPAREGYPLFSDQLKIGHITSGSFSPTLRKPIALGLIDRFCNDNQSIEVEIRQNRYPFQVVHLPFIKKGKTHEIHRNP